MDEKRENNIDLSMITKVVDKDLGLGTHYERWSLSRLLEKLYFLYDFTTVLEGSADGMAGIKGINSLPLAKLNCKVTVNLPVEGQIELAKRVFEKHDKRAEFYSGKDFSLDFPDSSFELVWNFCIAHILDTNKLIDEMVRVSSRYVLIIVPNGLNYGFFIHWLDHLITGERWNHGNIKYMNINIIEKELKKRGLLTLETFLVDVPFWPDIDKPIEMVAGDFLPFTGNFMKERAKKRYSNTCYEVHNLPYFSNAPEFQRLMNKLGFIEKYFPYFLKIFFAHHNGIIAEKTNI